MTQQINAAKLGNQMAFTYLWNFYWSYVYRFILNRTKNEILAREITHETFSRAFEKINMYNPDYEFKTWLCTIARNIHFNLTKKKKTTFIDIYENSFYFADPSPSPEDELIIKENQLHILNSINQLKPNYREVFLLRHKGMSYDEIVCVTGDSNTNVRTKLSRARRDLAVIFGKTKP